MAVFVASHFSALQQIGLARNTSSKVIWIIVLIVAILYATLQTLDIVTSFFTFSTTESITEGIISENKLAVTVCYRNRFNYSHVDINVKNLLNQIKNVNSSCDLSKPSLFCLSLLSEKDRFDIAYKPDDFLFKNAIYKKSFNNLFYGNCVTFKYEQSQEGKFTLKIPPAYLKLISPILVVHEEGTYPVFKPEDLIYVDSNEIKIKIEAIKESLIRTTVHDETYNVQFSESEKSTTLGNYKFSMDSCVDRCLYEITKKYCKCILPQSFLGKNNENLPICFKGCNKIPEHEFTAMCNCKPSPGNIRYSANKTYWTPRNERTEMISVISHSKKGLLFDNETTTEKFLINGPEFNKVEILIYISLLGKLESKWMLINLPVGLFQIGQIWSAWCGLSASVILFTCLFMCGRASHKCIAALQTLIHVIGLLFTILIMAFQIFLTIQDYIKFPVREVESITPQDLSDLPSIYVCSYARMNFNSMQLYENNFPALKLLKDAYRNRSFADMVTIYREQLNTDQKLALLPIQKEIFAACDFYFQELCGKLERQKFVLFGDPINCFIINATKQDKATDLSFSLIFPFSGFLTDDIRIMISLNPLNMIPSIAKNLPNDLIYVSPGDSLHTETKKLQYPYASNCSWKLSNDSFPIQIENARTALPYDYYEACLSWCSLQLREKSNAEVSANDLEKCNCQIPCWSKKYNLKITQKESVYAKKISSMNFTDEAQLLRYLWIGKAQIRIQRSSEDKKIISEKPKFYVDSLLEDIIWILRVWVGQSFLNIFVGLNLIILCVSSLIIKLRTKLSELICKYK